MVVGDGWWCFDGGDEKLKVVVMKLKGEEEGRGCDGGGDEIEGRIWWR